MDMDNFYFDPIREYFSYDNPKARFGKNPYIPKRLYSISSKGYMDIGLIWNVKKLCKERNYDVDFNISDLVKNILINPINIPLKSVPNKNFKLRDYQRNSISNAFKLGKGIGLIGTGGGKSLIIASMLESLWNNNNDFKTLLVVPNIGLVEQMYNDFEKYECSFSKSKWTGKNKLNSKSNVVIVNTGLLQRFDSDKLADHCLFFADIEYLFYDEVHLFGQDPEPKATTLLKEFDYKNVFGFTGSLNESTFASDIVYGYFGNPFYIKSSKELRDENYLTNVMIKMLYFNHNYEVKDVYEFVNNADKKQQDTTKNYNLEIEYITESKFRNDNIKEISQKLNGNTLLLVDRIIQGETLVELFKNITDKTVYFIRGSMPVEERNKIILEMEQKDNIICIAMSKIFSTGISINNIQYIIFYYIGKSWYKIIQSIGRGLRLHESKNKLYIFDMCDNMIYSEKHSIERKRVYKKEQIEFGEYQIYG